MRRRELNQEERELLNRTTKVDDERAIEEFLRSKRLRNIRESTIKYYEDAFRVLRRDINLMRKG